MAFNYYKSLTLDASQAGSADSTDWPLCIFVTDVDLKSVANGGYVEDANGYDIRPFADLDLTVALTYELVNYDPTTGLLEMYVKIPTLSASVDTVIYLGFGDSSIVTDGSSNQTWDANYFLVLHLSNGSVLSVTDSSQAGNDGVANGMVAATGLIDGGALASGPSTTDNLEFASLVAFLLDKTALTAQGFIKPNNPVNQTASIIINALSISLTFGSNRFYIAARSAVLGNIDPILESTDNAWTDGVWGSFAVVIGAAAQKLYANAAVVATNNLGFVKFDSNSSFYIGTNGIFATTTAPGTYDELRFSDIERSASWLTADHNNQKESSTFIAWGALTPVGPTPPVSTPVGSLISMGIPITLSEDIVYELPARISGITADAVGDIEVSLNGSDWQAVTLDSNNYFKTAAVFIRSVNADSEIIIKAAQP